MLAAMEQTPMELEFRPTKPREAHALTCRRGNCPDWLLRDWREEFQKFHEKYHYSSEELTFNFEKVAPGIPTRFRVRFEGTGRERIAVLTSEVPDPVIPRTASVQVPVEVDEVAHAPVEWRQLMLLELDKFIGCFSDDPDHQFCLKFALKRMRELATERPHHFTLMVFAAFIAAAHSEIRQERDPVYDHLFQAAAFVLERAVRESEFSAMHDQGLGHHNNGVWGALASMIEKWRFAR